MLRTRPKPGVEIWQVVGSSFAINHQYNPTFITNAHVVVDSDGNQTKTEDLAIVALAPGGAIAGASVRILCKELDIAIVEASKEAAVAKPVPFAAVTPIEVGTAVASLGFPIPEQPQVSARGGILEASERLATGFLSNDHLPVRMPNWPWTDNLIHYELNMLCYPGISGSPVFDSEGRVVGVNRGSRLYDGHIAAYGIAIGNTELLPFLDLHRIEYQRQ